MIKLVENKMENVETGFHWIHLNWKTDCANLTIDLELFRINEFPELIMWIKIFSQFLFTSGYDNEGAN